MKLSIILLASFALCTAQNSKKLLAEDEGLKNACQHYGGTYQTSEPHALYGPKCTITFPIVTKSDTEAKDLCNIHAPWTVIKATLGKQTVCEVEQDLPNGIGLVQNLRGLIRSFPCKAYLYTEATLRCEPGWIQMFGHCYKLFPEKSYTRESAENKCKAIDSRIARIHHKYQVGVWKRVYGDISQVWMDPSEAFTQYIVSVTEDSQAIALAFTGKHYHFHVHHNSLVRIDGDWRLQTLCEYRPQITLAHTRYLGERLSEIYHPFVNVDHGVLMRSASSYTRPEDFNKICQGVLHAARTKVRASFHPDDEALEALSKVPRPTSFVRGAAGAIQNFHKMKSSPTCLEDVERYEVPNVFDDYANYAVKFKSKNEPNHKCDNMLSTAFVHRRGETVIRSMSDAQPAPIYCKLGFTKQFKFEQIPGWKVIAKPDGTGAAHKWIKTKQPWWLAQMDCEKMGAKLSGFDSFKEMELLLQQIPNATADPTMSVEDRCAWLGAIRRKECRGSFSFSDDPRDKCSRSKVFEWRDGVATTNIDNSMWLDSRTSRNPDNTGGNQLCLQIIQDRNQKWAAPEQKGNMDDTNCDTLMSYFCQKPAKVLEVGYVFQN